MFDPNSVFLFVLAGLVIVFVIAQSVFFLVRAWRRGRTLGMDMKQIKKTIISTAIFTFAPAVSILLGVITLSKFLGLPLPWLRLSVIGAITYELPAATTTANALGITALSETIGIIRDDHRPAGLYSDRMGHDTGNLPGAHLGAAFYSKDTGRSHEDQEQRQQVGRYSNDRAFPRYDFCIPRDGICGYSVGACRMDSNLRPAVLGICYGNLRTFSEEMRHEVAGKLCAAHQYAVCDGVCSRDHSADRVSLKEE